MFGRNYFSPRYFGPRYFGGAIPALVAAAPVNQRTYIALARVRTYVGEARVRAG